MATSEDAGALWKLVAKTAAALLTTASVGVLFHGYWNHARKANIMRRAKRVTNKDEAIAALGSTALRPLGVLVKVSGTAVTQSPLTSGVSGMPVVIYSVNVDGRAITGHSSRMHVTPFSCRIGGNALVNIDASNMELELQSTVAEKVLRANCPILVVGTLTSSNDESFYLDSKLRTWTIVSYRSEGDLLRDYDFWSTVYFVSSAALLVVAGSVYFSPLGGDAFVDILRVKPARL